VEGDLGSATEDGAELARRLSVDFFRGVAAANLLGAALVTAFLTLVVPVPADSTAGTALFFNMVTLGYVLVAIPVGILWGRSLAAPVVGWLSEARAPTPAERDRTLAFPLLGYRVMGPLWAGAALLFGILNAAFGSPGFGAVAGLTIALGGVTTCTVILLWAERALRDVLALALRSGVPEEPVGPGVGARMVLAWALATGIPLFGVVLAAAALLLGAELSGERLAATALFLGALGLGVGLLGVWIAGRSVADPVEAVRAALAEVERGNLEAEVQIFQGSEVGLLAAGFNRMVAGLRERERLREAFGTFVDPELAERVLREGTVLAGEELPVSILFLDVRGFTTMAEQRSAREVVSALNDLYERVVPIVIGHGGHANKFIGDGMLAVFGAPERHDDHADRAVAAALEIGELVREDFPDGFRVGMGVNSGRVLVGTIGGGGRLDFTVIGDPVNTAARVEAATRTTGDDILITDATRELLKRDHGEFEQRPPVPLKGKAAPVRLYAPSSGTPARTSANRSSTQGRGRTQVTRPARTGP
jgi:adenylate cyclase